MIKKALMRSFLDITASSDRRETVLSLFVGALKKFLFPLRSEVEFAVLTMLESFYARSKKISVNTAAVERPELISEIAAEFGTQCVVLAIDAKKSDNSDCRSGYEVYVHGGEHPQELM